jgi:hypothetical protein
MCRGGIISPSRDRKGLRVQSPLVRALPVSGMRTRRSEVLVVTIVAVVDILPDLDVYVRQRRSHGRLASARSKTAEEAVIRGLCRESLHHGENLMVWASALLQVKRYSI